VLQRKGGPPGGVPPGVLTGAGAGVGVPVFVAGAGAGAPGLIVINGVVRAVTSVVVVVIIMPKLLL
jgi:hypothetical protein